MFLMQDSTNMSDENEAEQPNNQLLPAAAAELVLSLLPSGHEYMISSYDQDDRQEDWFTAVIRVNIFNQEDTEAWLVKFEESSLTQWRVKETFPKPSRNFIFKKGYRCYLNTLAKGDKHHKKFLPCEASLIITLKNGNMKRSADRCLKTLPLEIYMKHKHCHALESADSLRFRRPTESLKEKFTDLFRRGYSPGLALDVHLIDLHEMFGDQFDLKAADGALCPHLWWCYSHYHSIYNEAYKTPSGQDMLESLGKLVTSYNEAQKSTCAKLVFYSQTEDFTLAICTPMMKRVHEHLKHSGDIVFIETSKIKDQSIHVSVMLAYSVCGTLPLGAFVTYSDSEAAFSEGLSLLSELLPANCFGGKGDSGPNVLIVNDYSGLKKSLSNMFGNAVILVRKYNFLQEWWRFLWSNGNGIRKEHRCPIYSIVRELVNIEDQYAFEIKFLEVLDHPLIEQHEKVKEHLTSLKSRANEWAMCYRNALLTGGNESYNYIEADLRDDAIYSQLKTLSTIQMYDFLTAKLDVYFEQRIVSILNKSPTRNTRFRCFVKQWKTSGLTCFVISQEEEIFQVNHDAKGTNYAVNCEAGICTCPFGFKGAACKHQFAAVQNFNLSSRQDVPTADSETELQLQKIVLGSENVSENVCLNASSTSTIVPVSDSNGFCSSPLYVEPVIVDVYGYDIESGECGEPDSNDDANFDSTHVEECYEGLLEVAQHLKLKMETEGDEFVPAVKCFLATFKKCTSSSSLVSALRSFNHHSSS